MKYIVNFLYTPVYFLGFYILKANVATWCQRWLPHTHVNFVVQNALSTVTAMSILCMQHVYVVYCSTNDTCRQLLFRHGMMLCFSYYLYDTFIILMYDARKQCAYLVHHAVSLLIAHGMYTFAFSSVEASTNYIVCIELSNLFYGAWDILRRNRCEEGARRMYEAIVPCHVATYVSMRTLGLTLVTYEMWRHTQRHCIVYGSFLAFILCMSYLFSYKLCRKYHTPSRFSCAI